MRSIVEKRLGGRGALVESAVREALESLLSERSGTGVTVPAIAQRAGVSASSIYRRWGDVDGLVWAAVEARSANHEVKALGDRLTDDLLIWATSINECLCQPGFRSLLKAAIRLSPGSPSVCYQHRSAEAQEILARASDRGEGVPALVKVLDHVLAPMVMRALFDGTQLSRPVIRENIALALLASSTTLIV